MNKRQALKTYAKTRKLISLFESDQQGYVAGVGAREFNAFARWIMKRRRIAGCAGFLVHRMPAIEIDETVYVWPRSGESL